MKHILVEHEDVLGPWMMQKLGATWFPGKGSIIGLWDDREGPIAASLFEAHNGASVMLHQVGIGRKWLNREYLWFVFHYPFIQLGVRKIISPVESENRDSVRFIRHIGFDLEATLKDAAPKGDLLIFTMTKDQCRWLSLKEAYRGQTKRTSAS